MDEYPIALVKGFAQWLHDQQLAVYKTTGTYSENDTKTLPGVVINGQIPQFDHCLVLTVKQPVPDGRADIWTPIQIFYRIKGTSTISSKHMSKIFDALNGRENLQLNGVPISIVQYRNGVEFELDANGRASIANTYYFRGRRPQENRAL